MTCHHILQSHRYEFGLGSWRQSSADLANNLQCKMIVFIEECHHADRGIRAKKPLVIYRLPQQSMLKEEAADWVLSASRDTGTCGK